LIAALKQKLKMTESENNTIRQEAENLRRNLRLTKNNEIEVNILNKNIKAQIKVYDEECQRLRLMLKEFINEKHTGNPTEFQDMEERLLEQKVFINEQNKKNQELEAELKRMMKENEELSEKNKEEHEKEAKVTKLKEKLGKKKKTIESYKEKIQGLAEENTELKKKLDESKVVRTEKREDVLAHAKVPQEQNTEIEKLKKEKEEFKRRAEESERKAREKDRQIREEQVKFKDKEEELTLKLFEDTEKLNQRIVRRIIFLYKN